MALERVGQTTMHSLLGDWVPPLYDPVNQPRDLADEAPPTRALTQPVMLPQPPSAAAVEPAAPSSLHPTPFSAARIDLFDAKAWIYGREISLSRTAHDTICSLVMDALEADDAVQRSRLRAALLPPSEGMALPTPGEPGPPVVS